MSEATQSALQDLFDDPDHRSSVCDALLFPGKSCDCGRDKIRDEAEAEVAALRSQNATLGALYALLEAAAIAGALDGHALVAVDAHALAEAQERVEKLEGALREAAFALKCATFAPLNSTGSHALAAIDAALAPRKETR